MRPISFLWCCVGVWFCAVCHADTRFPYQLTVENRAVEARSGPGKEFYATDMLPVGTKIEVHRREGEWLGIRPPDSSYSLLPRTQLRMTDQPDVAEVTRDDAVCRIGSNVDKIKDYASQVHLHKGERVVVLDAKDGHTDRRWHRISPPAGEFRYVHATDLQGDQPVRSPTSTQDEAPEVIQVRQDDQEIYPSDSPRNPEPEESLEASEQDGADSEAGSDKWVSRRATAVDDLDEIEVQFSLMVTRDMRSWRLAPLRERAETLADALHTEADKSSARLLANRIREFEQLQNRFATVLGDTLPAGDNPSGPATGDAPPAEARSLTGVRYDGSGWLEPVHSATRLAPSYALLDAEGDVLQYVSPAPGLNLRRYKGKQVGIFGQRGHIPALKKDHLTAERVVELDRHLR